MPQLEKRNSFNHSTEANAVKIAIGEFDTFQTAASISQRSQALQRFASDVQPKLIAMLQTSLDLEELISIFHQEVKTLIPFDTLEYNNDREQISIIQTEVTNQTQHRISFSLTTNGDLVGSLHFNRTTKFKQSEIKLLEEASKAFIYPARNALRYKEALQSALTDALTQVGNRLAFDSALQKEIDIYERYKRPLTLLLIDIDHFKQINDQFGHSAGDVVLQYVATSLSETCRRADATFRIGGEEFAVILNNTTMEGATIIAERLKETIAYLTFDETALATPTTISIGVADLQEGESRTNLIARADAALYRAKALGRNRVVYSEPEDNHCSD